MAISYGVNPNYSNAYKLFHMHWLCRIPANEAMDECDFDIFGVALSNSSEWNERLATAMVDRQLSPAEMAQLNEDGVPLVLVDPKDSVTIYKLILEHLRDWRDATAGDAIIYDDLIPLQGLKEFNNLAALLVPIARCHGLVDDIVTKKRTNPNKVARWGSIRTKKIYQAKNASHSNAVYEEICNNAARRGQFVRGNRDLLEEIKMEEREEGYMTGSELYDD